MAQPLFCDFLIPSEKGPRYWWPIIFEAMGWKSFRFTAPGKPEGHGYYYYVNLHNYSDTDFVKSSFRAAWDRMFEETCGVRVSFWPSTDEEELFSLAVSLDEITPGQLMRVYLSLEDAYLLDLPRVEVHRRLTLTLDCAKALYEACRPCTGDLHWEEMSPIATFGNPPDSVSLEAAKWWKQNLQFVKQLLPDGSPLYLLDRIPVQVRDGWDFISLLE